MADGGYFDSSGGLDGSGGLLAGLPSFRAQLNVPRYGEFCQQLKLSPLLHFCPILRRLRNQDQGLRAHLPIYLFVCLFVAYFFALVHFFFSMTITSHTCYVRWLNAFTLSALGDNLVLQHMGYGWLYHHA